MKLERDILKKRSASSPRATGKYRFIEHHKFKFPGLESLDQ